MDQDDPVLAGYLLFPPHGNVLNKITKKKPWQQKYCMLFKASKQGIERLEVYDNKEDVTTCVCQRIITLENCIKITHTNPNNISIVTKSSTQLLSGITDNESIEWVTALQSIAFTDDASKRASLDQDNDLYCSSGEGVFSVKLSQSEASVRCAFEPVKYILLMTATAIELRNVDDNKLCATWPYRYIRRYGYRQGKFAFEAGRKCETGEGTFHFQHSNQQDIFRCLSMKIKSMKNIMNGESLHSLDCGDQFQAALSMEARSRSPLPLSARSEELNFSSMSTKSSLQLTSDSRLPLLANSSTSKPALKPKPEKPPRKHIFTVAKEKHEKDFTSDKVEFGKYRKLDCHDSPEAPIKPAVVGGPYDKVEIRNEAWKTLGLNEIDHTEFLPKVTQENSCLKLISRSQDNLDTLGPGESSKVIILQTPMLDSDDANYDRLQYFRSSNKGRSEGYKSVIARPLATQNNNTSKETWNDYDEVENVMQSVRLADDSYLGYGMIRKPSVPGPQVPIKTKLVESLNLEKPSPYSDIDHCTFNTSEYAIVSKPKRV